jgi:hypothetical protein
MKKLRFSALSCLLALPALLAAQGDWSPFPLQQRSFWQQGEEGLLHYCDQQLEGSTDAADTLLFGAVYRYGLAAELCFDTLVRWYFSPVSIYEGAPGRETPLPDTLYRESSWYYALEQGAFLPFYPQADFGFSWTVLPPPGSGFDSLRWSCTAVFDGTLEGQPTQFKRYTGWRYRAPDGLLDTLEILLSRDYGLVEYVPFQDWFAPAPLPRRLLGWEDAQGRQGFANSFWDYFGSIQAGSVFKYLVQAVFGLPVETIERDSVLSVSLDTASVTVVYARSYQVTRFRAVSPDDFVPDTIYYGDTIVERHYLRSDYAHALAQTPDWFFYNQPEADPYDRFYTLTEPLRFDTFGRISFATQFGEYIFLPECELSPADGCYRTFRLLTGVGLAEELEGCLVQGRRRSLIGYDIGGEIWGDAGPIDLISSGRLPEASVSLRLYPNPGRQELYLEVPLDWCAAASARLAIYDAAGRLVREGIWQRGQPVPAAGLLPGLYVVRLYCAGGMAQGRWVVGR